MSGEEYAQWLVGEFDADVSGWSPQKGEKARQKFTELECAKQFCVLGGYKNDT